MCVRVCVCTYTYLFVYMTSDDAHSSHSFCLQVNGVEVQGFSQEQVAGLLKQTLKEIVILVPSFSESSHTVSKRFDNVLLLQYYICTYVHCTYSYGI